MTRSAWEDTYLELVRLMKDAERRIDKQKLLIQNIQARGQDPAHAEELLDFFELVAGELRRNLIAMEGARGPSLSNTPTLDKRPLN